MVPNLLLMSICAADTCCYLCEKNMNDAHMCIVTCYFFPAKEERVKGGRWGPHVAVACQRLRLARGPARVRSDGSGVGARAIAGYRAKQAKER